jgi:hypothetical protein
LPSASLAGGFNRVLLNSESTNYDPVFTNSGAAIGASIATNNNLSMPPWSVAILGKTNLALPAIDANSNGIDDGIDLLTGGRAALPGTFNNWDTNTLAMKWDPGSKTYRYVARFSSPGVQQFRVLTTNWFPPTNQSAFSFTNTNVSTWEIRFAPSNGLVQVSNLGTNEMPDAWKVFHFDTNAFSASADPDGDDWNNLQEFQRGSDPTLHEESRFAVVGALNGWTWSNAVVSTNPFQMRYAGHGLWRFFRWFPIGTSDLSFKIAQGPTADDPNWGPTVGAPTSGFAQFKGTNFSWLTNLEVWQVLTFNERTGQYSIESFSTNSRDFDRDGMPDEWESFSGLDPTNSADATADADQDSVQNVLEFRRGSSARDAADHFYAMSMPASAFPFSPEQSTNSWQPSESRVAMKWNTNDARWHGLRYVSGSQTLRFKFAANNSWSRAWNWKGTNDVPGIALANDATNDITHQFAQAGYYTVMFDEHSGRYAISNMPTADTNNTNGIADYWEWFHGGASATVNPDGDIDSDTVLDKFEFARGSDPRNASDHYAVIALPGDAFPFAAARSWNDRADLRLRMVWRTNTGRWEHLRFVPRPMSYEVRAANPPFGPNDWAGTTVNQTLSFPSRGYYIVQFEEFSKIYGVVAMPTNDTNANGLADYWESYLGHTNPTADTDLDGVTTLAEFARGSDPSLRDKSTVMHVHGHVSGWNFTNAVPMRWNSVVSLWEVLLQARQTNESPQRVKFVSVTNAAAGWANPNWGETNAPADWVAEQGGGDIAYMLPGLPSYVLFEFDEVWGDYFAGPISTNDANGDGLADEWADYHRVTNAGGNSDNDSWLNISEYRRGSSPTNSDGDPKRMTVTGDTNAFTVPNWRPAANNMVWSDQRLRWEWSGTLGNAGTVQFKFSQATNNDWTGGKSWGAGANPGVAVDGGSNIFQTVISTKYLVHFDDITGIYGFVPHPVWLDWLKSNNLDTSTPRDPWPLDSDNDGVANFMEYALGGNPNAIDRTAVPVSATTNTNGTNRLVLRWLERTNGGTNLKFVPQVASGMTDNNGWSSLVSSNAADTSGVPANHRRKEVSVPIDGSGKFLRLRVNGP